MTNLLLAGYGWGALAAFNSLKHSASFNFSVLTSDNLWKQSLLAEGYKCINKMDGGFDLIVTAGYKPILPPEVVNKYRILNIHYSLLPAYRGLHSTVWAIINNEPMLGLTIHRINEFIDDGPIVYQYSTRNNFVDTATDYMKHFNSHIEKVLLRVVNDYLAGLLPEIPQDKTHASWVGRRRIDHCQINFAKPVEYQKAFFRALNPPYPYPYFVVKNQVFEIRDAGFHNISTETDTGRILNIDGDGVWISCEHGYIICKRIFSPCFKMEIEPTFFKIGQFVGGLNQLPELHR